MKQVLLSVMLLITNEAFTQNQKNSNTFHVQGFSTEFMISTDFKAVYFSYIGAGVKYTKGNTTVSFTVFPSLRFYKDNPADPTVKPRPFVTPGLAVGSLIQHKRLLVGMPVFYVAAEAKWHYTVGVGYVFGKK